MSQGDPVFEAGAASDVGCVRQVNEDSFLVHPEAGIWAVADGMGGHSGGATASAHAVDALRAVRRPGSVADLLAQCEHAIRNANARIRAGTAFGETVGTTLVALLVFGTQFACVWCGDSRLYRVREGAIEQWSEDHTEVQELLASGLLTPDQAKTWPRRNVVTRAVGTLDVPELDIRNGDLRPGDVFVLCSDGLTNHVTLAEILDRTVAGAPQAAADALVTLTLERGATDNVTVVVVGCLQPRREPTVVLGLTPPGAEAGRHGG